MSLPGEWRLTVIVVLDRKCLSGKKAHWENKQANAEAYAHAYAYV